MSEIYTQEDSDNLADIIWWIKGYNAACDNDNSICHFGNHHLESLRKARIILKDKIQDKKETQT